MTDPYMEPIPCEIIRCDHGKGFTVYVPFEKTYLLNKRTVPAPVPPRKGQTPPIFRCNAVQAFDKSSPVVYFLSVDFWSAPLLSVPADAGAFLLYMTPSTPV